MRLGLSAMQKVSLRTLAGHKIRFILTILSVVLGTAFIAGSFMFTNSMSKSFDSIAESSYANVDAVVKPGHDGKRLLNQQFFEELQKDPAVKGVNISSQANVIVATKDKQVLNSGGAPSIVQPFYTGDQAVATPMNIVDGTSPHGPGEIVLNQTAASRHGIHVGDTVVLVDPHTRHEVTVVGVYTLDLEVGGFIGAAMDEPSFIQLFRPQGTVDEFTVAGKTLHGSQLVNYLAGKYPGVEFDTGESIAEDLTDQINQALSFVNYFLIAFGLIALLVGTFIIANTFSMIVAQRMREFALLRSLGTSRRQLTGSVVFEAIVIGFFGSALGIAAGIGLVNLIYWGMTKAGMGLPDAGVNLTPTAVFVPLVLGIIVTVLSAWAPARRAGRVRPVEALRLGDASSSSSLLTRSIAGVLLIGIGVAAAIAAVWIFTDATSGRRASIVGVAALLLIVGTFLVLPAVSVPVVGGLGRVIGLPFRAVGKLASTNSKRNPRRTATTAFALTLGVALVSVVSIFGATMKNSVSEFTETMMRSDYVVSGPAQANFPVPREATAAIRQLPDVQDAVAIGTIAMTVGDVSALPGHPLMSVVDGDPTTVANIDMVDGDSHFNEPGVMVDKTTAEAKGWKVGDTVPLSVGVTEKIPVGTATIRGIYQPNIMFGPAVINQSMVTHIKKQAPQMTGSPLLSPQVLLLAVNGNSGIDQQKLREELETVTSDYLVVQVLTTQQFAGAQAVMIDQILNILYALLSLAIIVAILGIINTLALNVVERRQEVGMLRAVGTKRRQIRGMITLEAVQIAVFGALVGVGIGLFLGWAFVSVLGNEGLGHVIVPWTQVALMIVGSAFVGVVAAVWPAVKAAKTPPLEAIAD
ncbi:FtsX-like permease family protein [Corynebacterium sp. 4HC-13]|uniref:ABC transporter permease n=1 Tax=Corynebacterium anserum TaxID=2684406 RepID=UPI00163A2683|nr:ABC transporter permease [Corynebacterium anserum]MBC2680956.1 FtsX-like permease family protein [Corynebacterium anserum]